MRRGGFTLIEVMVATALLVALSAVAVITVAGSRTQRLIPEALERVTHGVNAARASAILQGRPLGLIATVRPDGAWVLAVTPELAAEDDAGPTSQHKPRRVAQLPDGVQLTPVPDGIGEESSDAGPLAVFLPDGRCLPRGMVKLTRGEEMVQLRFRRIGPGVERVEVEP